MVEKQKAQDTPNKRLGPFEVGQILTLSREGLSQRKIADKVEKADGSFGIGFGTVCRVLQKRKRKPSWTGERAQGSGRGRSTTPAQDKAMGRMMRRNRGRKKTALGTLEGYVGSSGGCRWDPRGTPWGPPGGRSGDLVAEVHDNKFILV